MNERAKKAEKSLKEAQTQISELNAEKSRLVDRVDTLEAGNEKFMELKEEQDREVQHLRSVHQELHNKVGGFEWQLSEKDEQIDSLQQQVQDINELNSL